MQDPPPFSPNPDADEAPTGPLPRVSPARRNRLGSVTFVVVLLGAVLAVLPSTAGFGFLLCLLAIVPATIAFWRSRKGKATGGRRALAAVVMAPAFLVVAVAVGAATAPPARTPLPAAATTLAVVDAASAAVPQVQSAPESALVSTEPAAAAPASAAPAVVAQAAAPVAAPPPVAAPAPAAAPAPVAAPAAAPVVAPAPQAAPQRVVAASAAKRQAAPRLPAPAPKPAPKPVAQPAPGCDEETHYINSSGNCVLRPVAAPSAPAGASAKCGDGTYSFSQHRQGTCSRHGGVAAWL